MTLSRCLAAAAMLGLSVSAATACDDYADEMAMIAAKRAVAEAAVTVEQDKPAQDAQTASQDVPGSRQAPTVASAADPMRR